MRSNRKADGESRMTLPTSGIRVNTIAEAIHAAHAIAAIRQTKTKMRENIFNWSVIWVETFAVLKWRRSRGDKIVHGSLWIDSSAHLLLIMLHYGANANFFQRNCIYFTIYVSFTKIRCSRCNVS